MPTHQDSGNDSPSSERRRRRVINTSRADDTLGNSEARNIRQSRQNANASTSNLPAQSRANSNIPRQPHAQNTHQLPLANQTAHPTSRVQFNTSDTSTWTAEMHRQYHIIQTPLTLQERIWDRRGALLPSGFHNTVTPTSFQTNRPSTTEEVEQQQQQRRPHHAAAGNVPALSGIGAWTEQHRYEGIEAAHSATAVAGTCEASAHTEVDSFDSRTCSGKSAG